MEPIGLSIGGLGPLALFVVSFGLLGSIFWVWMLAECTAKKSEAGNTKIVWTGVIVFTHFIGAALYFLVRRPKRRAEAASWRTPRRHSRFMTAIPAHTGP